MREKLSALRNCTILNDTLTLHSSLKEIRWRRSTNSSRPSSAP